MDGALEVLGARSATSFFESESPYLHPTPGIVLRSASGASRKRTASRAWHDQLGTGLGLGFRASLGLVRNWVVANRNTPIVSSLSAWHVA